MNQLILHISPVGKDSWSGQRPAANAEGTDGPLRTLAGAQAAVGEPGEAVRSPAQRPLRARQAGARAAVGGAVRP